MSNKHDDSHSDSDDSGNVNINIIPDSSANYTILSNTVTDSSHNIQDSSTNYTILSNTVTDSSHNIYTHSYSTVDDCSDNGIIFDISAIAPIVTFSMNQTITQPGFIVTNQQGTTADGIIETHTTFTTTDPSSTVQVTENLVQTETYYNDEIDASTNLLVQQIKLYASEIQCSDFHGKGTIEDYTILFQAASKIATDSHQITLDVDIQGFNEFGQAADELSALFESFIIKLQNINIINDYAFLTSITIALQKIVNLSNIFGRFKQTILATSTIELPKSAKDTALALSGVMDEINCAMQYVNYFVQGGDNAPVGAHLKPEEQNIIRQAVVTIDNWNLLCEQGVSISMTNDAHIKSINQASRDLKSTSNTLKQATATLKTKLMRFNLC
jgi:hypothetical protein